MNGVAIVHVAGQHDLASASEIDAAIGLWVEHGTNVVVDVALLTFADSAVLHTLFDCQRRAEKAGVGLAIRMGRNPAVGRLFGMVALSDAIPCAPDLRGAIGFAASARTR